MTCAEAWDAIRIDNEDTPFSIPKDRSSWIDKCLQNKEIIQRAKAVVALLHDLKITGLFSMGVGAAFLEYNIKTLYPEIFLACFDFSPHSVKRLQGLFKEADLVENLDMLKGGWKFKENSLYLFHRIDQEFNDAQWKKIFNDIAAVGVEYVLFIPCGILGWGSLINEKLNLLKYRIQGKPVTFAGYLRSKDAFYSLWQGSYRVKGRIRAGGLSGFLLVKD